MAGGRPLKFESVETLQKAIDGYFEVTPVDEWTWTGLALHLDTSRETLREYQLRDEFVDPLKKALLKVENGYEKDLKKHGRTGTIFALKNFNWQDKQEIKHEGIQASPAVNIYNQAPPMAESEDKIDV